MSLWFLLYLYFATVKLPCSANSSWHYYLHCFWQGLIQSVFELQDGSGVVITVGKYVTPNHKDINGNGIEPDFQKLPGKAFSPLFLFFLFLLHSQMVIIWLSWSYQLGMMSTNIFQNALCFTKDKTASLVFQCNLLIQSYYFIWEESICWKLPRISLEFHINNT